MLAEAQATDYFGVHTQFTDEQWAHFTAARRFVDEEVLPVINGYWEAAELPWPLMRRLAELGFYGEDIEGYGCPGMSPLARGLVNMELHRGDGSLGTFLGVQSGLAMQSIALHGSPAQKERWLPALARLDAVGAFALTEPATAPTAWRWRPARGGPATAGSSTAPSAGSATARSPTSWWPGRATRPTAR
jgi:glutaryl-CoA dehydrogenase